MIKEIVFDCFGVLTQDGWITFLEKYGNQELSEELRYINHQTDSGLISFDEFLNEACRLTGAEKSEAYSMVAKNYHPNEKLFEYIKVLKKEGYEVGVISNVGTELSNLLPEEYLKIFDRVTLSYQVGSTKPDSKIFEAHLQKSGYKPAEVIFIDDREVNCEGAQAVGMKALMYQNLEQLKRDIRILIG